MRKAQTQLIMVVKMAVAVVVKLAINVGKNGFLIGLCLQPVSE